MHSDIRGVGGGAEVAARVHMHPLHPGWIRPCFILSDTTGYLYFAERNGTNFGVQSADRGKQSY